MDVGTTAPTRDDSAVTAPIGDDDIDAVVANDPFRLSNAPSRVAYDARGDASGTTPAGTPPTIRPNLVLKAIVGGPPWQAVIDGLPGAEAGAVATQGTVFGDVVIRSVARDRVVIQGRDTAWVLTFGGAP